MRFDSPPRLALVGLTLTLFACGPSADEDLSSADAQLALEQRPLPTLRATLSPGDPYSPFTDDRPLVVTGEPPCIVEPRVEIAPGATEVSAAIVGSRRELLDRLDLGVEGIPVDTGALAGATGSARIAIDTEVDDRSLSVMFQAKGTYESALVGVGAAPPTFDPARVARCGWGYVQRAYHRLSAVVIVTIAASDGTSRVRFGCGRDEAGCTGSSVGAGPAKAKLALEAILKQGHFDIRVRSVADVIPGLAPTPFGEMVAMSSTPETAADVLAKLDRSLAWLGGAQAQIAARIGAIREDPRTGAAPTVKVAFTYWPGTSPSLRERAGSSFDELAALRVDRDRTLQRLSSWQSFEDDRALGRGYLHQIPDGPLSSVSALTTRGAEAREVLSARLGAIEARIGACADAARAPSAGAVGVEPFVSGLERACRREPAAAWEPTYGSRFGVRRLAPLSSVRRTYDEWRDGNMCAPGQRLAKVEEAALLGPWSHANPIWVQRASFFAQPRYLERGRVVDVGLFAAPEAHAVCFDAAATTLFD